MDEFNIDKFSPVVEPESVDYLLPEDQLKVENEARACTSEISKCEFRSGPSYLSSCYDEFSRRYISVNIAKSSSPVVQPVKFDSDANDEQSPSSILQQYHPGYSEWASTFRKVPLDLRHLISGKVATDTNLVVRLKKCQINQKIFEPLFGSICLYALIGDELLRISETFYFDATPEAVRKLYPFAYLPESQQEASTDFAGNSINVGDGTGSGLHMNMFCATLPEELRGGGKDIFLVMQLSKILSTDADKAVAPYYARGGVPDIDKHRESCKRLFKFRQPVALGVVRINECLSGGKTEVKFPLYAQKLCVSEGFIAQSIREIYPADGAAPYCRMELLDAEMQLILHDLGRHDMLNAALREQGMAVQVKPGDGAAGASSKPVTPSSRSGGVSSVLPRIYPSQVPSAASPLRFSRDLADLSAVAKNSAKLVIRQVMPLLPATIGKEVTRQFKTNVDNSMFVYPVQLERFQNRNLCLKMELVELTATSNLTSKTILTAPYTVLPHIYNQWSIVGPLFVPEAYSRVSYHVKNPVLTDEFKIRLPDVLTGRHWLRFTVLHIHVKPTVGRQSLLSSLIRSSVDKAEVESVELGVGMLPVMFNGGECLQEDKDHTLYMTLPGADTQLPPNEQPFIRFRTRAVTSLVSSDAKVQAALRHHPCPLGYLPSSIMSSEAATEILLSHKTSSGSAERLVTATQDLSKASAVELSRHFLVIMRQLLRTLTAGHGVFDEELSNPYRHNKSRSQAFLTILQVVGKIAGSDVGATSSSSAGGGGADALQSQEKEFLHAYVDFLFDEEVPIARHPSYLARLQAAERGSARLSLADGGNNGGGKMPERLSLALVESTTSDVPVSARSENTDSTYTAETSVNDINVFLDGSVRPAFKSTPSQSNYELISPKSRGALPPLPPTVEEEGSNLTRRGSSHSVNSEGSSPGDGSTKQAPAKQFLSRTAGSQQMANKKHSRPAAANTGFKTVTEEAVEEGDTELRERIASSASNVSGASLGLDDGDAAMDLSVEKVTSSEVDSPTPAQTSIDNQLEDPLTCESPENVPLDENAENENNADPAGTPTADRRSWGKFITDAVWSSGQLKSLGAILSGGESGVDFCQLGELYLEDIATHIVLQAERIVLERMISVAALAMVSQVRFNSERKQVGEEGLHSVDEVSVLAGKRFHAPRYAGSLSADAGVTPFCEDRSWFAAVDAGQLVDESELLVGFPSYAKDANSLATAAEGPGSEGETGALVAHSTITRIAIQPILPRYDTVDGYRERTASIAYSQYQSLAGAAGSAFQWWPWLYEVIVYQWSAVLAITLKANSLISNTGTDSIVGNYPYDYNYIQKMEGQRDTRSLLMEHGPVLLKMVFKSLALRIAREHKRPPVVLDDQFLNALENLVMLLAVEAKSFKTGLWRCRWLIQSLASFLRSLFGLVVPNQVIKLIRTYFKAVRKGTTDVEAAQLRLQMLEEAALFDHVVAVNFPYTLDAPHSLFAFSLTDPQTSPVDPQATVAFTSAGFRSTHYLPPYALAHMIVLEVMSLYRLEERKVKSAALEILRDLLVRHTYDARYQSSDAQQRVVCMYLPLLQHVVEESASIAALRHDAVDRRELLAMALHILQNMPHSLLRHRIRSMCVLPEVKPTVSHGHPGAELHASITTLSAPRIISLKQRPSSLAAPQQYEFVQKSPFQDMPIHKLILLLHLVLDTFELPKIAVASVTVNMVALAQVLSPAITVSTADDGTDGATLMPSMQSSTNLRRSVVEPTVASSSSSRVAKASSLLTSLDQRMQTRKTNASAVATRRSLGGTAAPNAVAANSVRTGDERKWKEHARKMAVTGSVKDRSQALSKESTTCASRNVCWSATTTVLEILCVLLEEVPSCILSIPLSSYAASPFVLRDCNLDESLLVGVPDLRIVEFMKSALAVLLHALFCQQEDSSVVDLLRTGVLALRRFGAKVFLVAVEDSLQDWMRVCLFYCAAPSLTVRDEACNFLLCLMRSCHHFTGSFTLVSNTVLAVLNDVLSEVLESCRGEIVSHSDEDRALQGLQESVGSMMVTAQSKYSATCWDMASGSNGASKHHSSAPSSFYLSVARLMEDLQLLLQANSDMRRFVPHPVGYDYLGANMLDGPLDERAFALSQLTRQQRKAVKIDGVPPPSTSTSVGAASSAPASSSSSSGFQIEEVMMRFVRAAELYDPVKLPRFRIQWLENLARLHEVRSNRAEGAEVRWRIFQLCQSVEDTWQQQWVPRPPLVWMRRGTPSPPSQVGDSGSAPSDASGQPSNSVADRNFHNVFLTAMNGQQYRAWNSYQQYVQHMITTLDVATDRFCLANLIHLAERTSAHLVQLYRLSKQVELIGSQYHRVFQAFRTMTEKGITSTMAVGTFYRVCYEGLGAPPHLRGKEFIFRNANHLHVSEFQALVVSHLKSLVQSEGVEVRCVQDLGGAALKNLHDPAVAYMVMSSVKLVAPKAAKTGFRAAQFAGQSKRPVSLNRLSGSAGGNGRNTEALNQVSVFQYSVPFTKDPLRAHAKQIDEQWLRTTILTVSEPFPYILTRQLVLRRETRDYCPIEVATNDIEERIESMEAELDRPEPATAKNALPGQSGASSVAPSSPSDNNNLMRIVQGTVMPQVNGGAAEVAKVFLSPHKLMSDSVQLQLQIEAAKSAAGDALKAVGGDVETKPPQSIQELSFEEQRMKASVTRLKLTLGDFLTCSKLLLAKTRRILLVSDSTASDGGPSAIDNGGSAAAPKGPVVSTGNGQASKKGNDSVVGAAGSGGNQSAGANAAAAGAVSSVELNYRIWQTEMERGFELLVQSIAPYIKDVVPPEALSRLSTTK